MATRVLMVCLGNICRSPMAEGILRHKGVEAGLDLEIDSCGTSGYHIGEAPDERARAQMRKKGIDISDLRARQLVPEDIHDFDEIFAMDASNLNALINLTRTEKERQKVKLILDESRPGHGSSVPDPYYGGDQGFEHVFHLLEEACEAFIDRIQHEERNTASHS